MYSSEIENICLSFECAPVTSITVKWKIIYTILICLTFRFPNKYVNLTKMTLISLIPMKGNILEKYEVEI